MREGGSDGSEGHPDCAFCQIRFYDKTELYKHVTKDHHTCHLCSREGAQFKYYKDQKMLDDHFRKEHFTCDEAECKEKRVVFKSLFDLQGDDAACPRSIHLINSPYQHTLIRLLTLTPSQPPQPLPPSPSSPNLNPTPLTFTPLPPPSSAHKRQAHSGHILPGGGGSSGDIHGTTPSGGSTHSAHRQGLRGDAAAGGASVEEFPSLGGPSHAQSAARYPPAVSPPLSLFLPPSSPPPSSSFPPFSLPYPNHFNLTFPNEFSTLILHPISSPSPYPSLPLF